MANFFRRAVRVGVWGAEIALLSAIILITRCENFGDVFVGGKIFFVDADCYSRMTRAQMVAAHPGLVVRHHDFENFPSGVSPHTTAPLDYLIVALAKILAPFSAQALDLAGALVSPLLALVGGWFFWWWTRHEQLPYRWSALIFYVACPILAHGTSLGRPDHQSLLIVLLLFALAAEWSLAERASRAWSVASGASWGFAFWISLYEPLWLLVALIVAAIFFQGKMFSPSRNIGWLVFGAVLLLAALIERHWPALPEPALRNFFSGWSSTIGELQSVSLTNPVWWQWFGLVPLALPVLLVPAMRRSEIAPVFVSLLALTFLLTIWQARWGYFLAIFFCLTIPSGLAIVRQGWLGYTLLVLALFPIWKFWDAEFWPNDRAARDRDERRGEASAWRALASSLGNASPGAFLAPWWLSPSAVYWSGRPAVAGSSHESLAGIVESARFFLASQPNDARNIARRCGVRWILAGDADQVAQNSAAILGEQIPPQPLCLTLDRAPSRVPTWLVLVAQNRAGKLYQVRD